MKKLLVILLPLISVASYSQNGTKNFIDQNFIEVTGKAEMKIVPNEIYLKILLNQKDFKGKKNFDEVEKSMAEKLTEIGIDISKKLEIKDMTSNFQNYWLKNSSINSIKEYQLNVKNAKTAGYVYKELESLGISNITIVRIEHSGIEKFRKEVKINAIKAAKEKAKLLTNAIGQNVGNAIYIQELNNQNYKALQGAAGGSSFVVRRYSNEFDKEKKTEIEFEKIKLEYSILIRFEITE